MCLIMHVLFQIWYPELSLFGAFVDRYASPRDLGQNFLKRFAFSVLYMIQCAIWFIILTAT